MSSIDDVLAKSLEGAQKKFGKKSVYRAADHDFSQSVIRCPTAVSYLNGGIDGLPAWGVMGCDGLPGMFKSALTMEYGGWVLSDGGLVIRIDNEERTSPEFLRSFLTGLTWEQRGRMLLGNSSSVEGWQEQVRYWRTQAERISDLPKDEQAPMVVIVDSLTGRATRGEEKTIKTEGSAQARTYSESAMSISKFYKALNFRGQLFTLWHVQHAKRNFDQYASADDSFNSAGGDEPRFQSNLHLRILRQTPFKYATFAGRELTIRSVKTSLGDKNQMVTRVCWKYEWRNMPVYTVSPSEDGESNEYTISYIEGKTWSSKDAKEWWDLVNPFLPRVLAEQLMVDMGLEKEKSYIQELTSIRESIETTDHKAALTKLNNRLQELLDNPPAQEVPVPCTEQEKVQISWWDWDFSLGWIVNDMLENGFKDTKDRLTELMPGLSNSGCNKYTLKCEALTGYKDPVGFTEFGMLVESNAEVLSSLKKILNIKSRVHYRDAVGRSDTDGGKQKNKK